MWPFENKKKPKTDQYDTTQAIAVLRKQTFALDYPPDYANAVEMKAVFLHQMIAHPDLDKNSEKDLLEELRRNTKVQLDSLSAYLDRTSYESSWLLEFVLRYPKKFDTRGFISCIRKNKHCVANKRFERIDNEFRARFEPAVSTLKKIISEIESYARDIRKNKTALLASIENEKRQTGYICEPIDIFSKKVTDIPEHDISRH